MKKDASRVAASTVWLAWTAGAAMMLAAATLLAANENRDPKAVEIAHALRQAMGGARGEQGWDSLHFVRFDFKVTAGGKVVENNRHLWDRRTGRYRLERMPKGGRQEVILFNEGNRQGTAYVNGKALAGEPATKSLEDAYGSYINDMWWLAMPWKWLDTGVNMKYIGTKNTGGDTYDVVQLTFAHVGLTPGDMYHAFVSRKSHLMMHWDYVLESHDRGAWNWEYGDHDGIKLASNHISSDHKASINMGDVRTLDTVDDTFFTDPSHMLSDLK